MIKKIGSKYKVNITGYVPNVIMNKINELIEVVNEQEKTINELKKQISRKADFINPMFPD
jgi:hypothetical protein